MSRFGPLAGLGLQEVTMEKIIETCAYCGWAIDDAEEPTGARGARCEFGCVDRETAELGLGRPGDEHVAPWMFDVDVE